MRVSPWGRWIIYMAGAAVIQDGDDNAQQTLMLKTCMQSKGLKKWKLLVQKSKIFPNLPGYYCHLQCREESLTGILRPTSTSKFYASGVMFLKLLWLLKHLQCQKKRIITYIHNILYLDILAFSINWLIKVTNTGNRLSAITSSSYHPDLILIYPHIWPSS